MSAWENAIIRGMRNKGINITSKGQRLAMPSLMLAKQLKNRQMMFLFVLVSY